MKTPFTKYLATGLSLACLLLAQHEALAGAKTFISSSGNSWNTAANWSNSAVPTAADSLLFNSSSTATTGLDAAFTIGSLSFDTGATAFNINANSAGTTARTLTLNGATSALGNATTFIDTGATTTGTISLGATSGLGTLTVAMASGSTGAINVANSSANLIFGQYSTWSVPNATVNKIGAGTWTLAGGMTGPGSSSGLTLNVKEGTVTVASTGVFAGSQASTINLNAASGVTSYFNLNGTSTSHQVGGSGINIAQTAGGAGVMNITAGTLTMIGSSSNPGTKNMTLGAGGFGVLNMSGGTVSEAGNLVIGNNGGATSGGILNISGGTYGFTARGAATSNPVATIAAVASSKGVLNMTGGTLDTDPTPTSYSSTVTNALYVGEQGAGVLNVSGSANLLVGGAAKGTITGVTNNGLFVGGNTGSAVGSGVVNLITGGTISTSRVLKGSSATSGIFNFHGGILRAATGVANATFMSNLSSANIYSEGATIDNNSQSITINQVLSSPSLQGASSISSAASGFVTSGYTTAPLVSITGGSGTGMTANALVDASGNLTGFTVTNPGSGYQAGDTITVTLIGGGKASNSSSTGAVTLADNATTGSLTLVGSGTTILAGGNTYKGTTNINAGTAVFGNSLGASSIGDVVVADGAALGIRVNSNSASILSLGNANLTLGSSVGSTLAFDFNSMANSTASLIAMASGTLTLNGTPNYSFANSAGLTNGTITLIDYGSLVGSFTPSSFSLGTRTVATTSNDTVNTAILLTVSADRPVWSGGLSSEWSTNTLSAPKNWNLLTSGSATDFIAGDDVLFDDTATGTTSIDISAANVLPGTVTFNNTTAKTYNISSSGGFGIAGGNLTKNNTGTVILTTDNSYTGATTINGGVLQLGNGGTTGSLSPSSAIMIGDGASLAFNRADNIVQGTHFSTAAISGSGSVVKDGQGSLTLNASNSFTGGLFVKSGTVIASGNSGAFGAGAIALGDASGSANATLATAGNLSIANAINVTSGNSGTAAIVNNDTGAATYTGTMTLNSHDIVIANNAGSMFLNGVITGTGALVNSGVNSIQFNGTIAGNVALRQSSTTGMMDLQAANTSTGGVYIDAGVVLLHNRSDVLGNNSVYLGAVDGSADAEIRTVNNTQNWTAGVLTVNSGSGKRIINIGNFSSGNASINPTSIVLNNDLTVEETGGGTKVYGLNGAISGTGNLILQSWVATSGSSSGLTLGGALNQNGSITVSNPTGFGSGGVSLNGAIGAGITSITQNSAVNPLYLNAANTAFAGSLTVNAGSVKLGNASALNSANAVTLAAGATLDLNGNSNTIAGLSGSGTATNTATSAKTLTLGGSGNDSFSGVIADGATAGNMALAKNGTGTQILSGVNTYTGATTINSGTLTLSGEGAIDSSVSVTVANGATLDVSTKSAAFTVGAGKLLNVNGVVNGPTVVSGSLAGGSTGSINGTLAVNGASMNTADLAVTGAMTINGAANTLAGSLNANGGATVASEATLTLANGVLCTSFNTLSVAGILAGSGTINGVTAITGTLSPGISSSVGVIALNNNVSLNGGTFAVKLDNDGNASDKLTITGGLDLSSGLNTLVLSLLNSTPTGINNFVIATYTGALNGTFAAVTGLPEGYAVDYSVAGEITVAAVPEPGTWAMLVGGLGMLSFCQRLRRQK